MNRFLLNSIIILVAAVLSGCGASGAFNTGTLTEVQLSEDNYEIVATDVTGEASAGYILGVSASTYRQMQSLAIARVSGSGNIYGEALNNLWDNFERNHGEAEGRNLALVNVRYDTDALNLIIYTSPTVIVRADVIEFR